MKYVNQPVVKKDAYALLSGKPVYCDDLALKDCLVIKLLRSPHAHARILDIDTTAAKRIPGIVEIYTYKDVPGSLSLIHIYLQVMMKKVKRFRDRWAWKRP